MPFETRAGVENVSEAMSTRPECCSSSGAWCRKVWTTRSRTSRLSNAPSHADLPKALLVTCGFDMLRDVGHAYAKKLAAGGKRHHLRASPGPAAWLHPDDGAFEALSRSHTGAGGIARRRPRKGQLGLPAVAGCSPAKVEHTSSPSRPLLTAFAARERLHSSLGRPPAARALPGRSGGAQWSRVLETLASPCLARDCARDRRCGTGRVLRRRRWGPGVEPWRLDQRRDRRHPADAGPRASHAVAVHRARPTSR